MPVPKYGRQVRGLPIKIASVLLVVFFAGQCLSNDQLESSRIALRKASQLAINQAKAPMIGRETLLQRPVIANVGLSPDGRYLSFLRRNEQGFDLWLQEVENGMRFRLLADVRGAEQRWSGDGSRLWMADELGLAVIEPATHKAKRILKWNAARKQSFVGVDKRAPAYALMTERIEQNHALRYRYLLVDVTGKTRLLHEAALPLRKLLLRKDGSLVFTAAFDGANYDTVIRRYNKQGVSELARCHGIEVCELVGYGRQENVLWMLAQRGEDKTVLQRWQAGQPDWKTVHRDPANIADAEGLIWNNSQNDWQAIAYYGAKRRWHGNSAEMKADLASLQKHLPDANLQLTQANDRRVWLVDAEQSNWPLSRHFLYEPGKDKLRPLFSKDDATIRFPPSHQLTTAQPVSWRARDGMVLHGYVYLPQGVALGKAPLIAWLHGGPVARLYDDYDPRLQLLTNRGYAVFLPNFRISNGYGLRYLRAANGDVGNGRVLSDVIDGLDFLLAQGIGDRNRQAVVGHSFGGYASLLAASHYPQRFRFAFAGAPPTDYGWMKQWQAEHDSESLHGDGPPLALSLPQHGLPYADAAWRQKMKRESPLNSVSKLRTPIYIWAGGKDDHVPIKSIANYASEARRHGKTLALLIDPDAGHTPAQALGSEAWVFMLESVADRHFGGGLTPASPELDTFLRKHLLIDTQQFLLTGKAFKRF
ncbi:MAG: alpha/beta fold hydrolase [Arenimonas sp.]